MSEDSMKRALASMPPDLVLERIPKATFEGGPALPAPFGQVKPPNQVGSQRLVASVSEGEAAVRAAWLDDNGNVRPPVRRRGR